MDPRVGQLIGDPARRAAWRAFLAALDEAAAPGGPLEGWLFHGTSRERAALIEAGGVTTTHCIVPGEPGGSPEGSWVEAEGTHWGTPLVAGFYAEDLIESCEDPGLDLAVVAVRMSDLEACGPLATDGQTIDCPLYSRLPRPEAETDALWEASDGGWRACLDLLGTLVVLGPVGEESVVILRDADDLHELADALAGPRP